MSILKRPNMLGKRFGRLVVVAVESLDKHYNVKYLCECDCGKICTKLGGNLRRGSSTNCGCVTYEHLKTHGKTNSREYRSWVEMKRRCYDKNRIEYKNYGARGITVCDEWLSSFSNFFKDMGERPAGHTLDRIDNSGNYEPQNCKWSSTKDQSNNKRNNVYITYSGKRLNVAEWARESEMKPQTIYSRIRYGWSADKIFKEGKTDEYIKKAV